MNLKVIYIKSKIVSNKITKPQKKKERFDFLDIYRGLPLFIMVAIQIFDYLWVKNIYLDAPAYIDSIQAVMWIHPPIMFAFISGVSAYLLTNSLLKKTNDNAFKSWIGVVKRYGIYILVSLPFTCFMWNVMTFVRWDETIQGMGLGAIALSAYLILTRKWNFKWYHHSLFALILIFVQGFLPHYLDTSYFFTTMFPREPVLAFSNFFVVIVSTIINALIRGWFSVIHIIPYMIGGFLFVNMIKNIKKPIVWYATGAGLLLVSIILHFNGFLISYYNRSFALSFYGLGESILLGAIIYHLYIKGIFKQFHNTFYIFGRATIVSYLGHYILILKVLVWTGLADHLPEFQAWVITFPLVCLVYLGSRMYLRWKGYKLEVF